MEYGIHPVSETPYRVRMVGDLTAELADAIGNRRSLVVCTPTVYRLYGSAIETALTSRGLTVGFHIIASGESAKTMETALDICEAAVRRGLGRRDPLVSFGGGICSDLVTLAASMLRRGAPYICVPTTLLAQVDAGVGLKGGVNFAGKKNYLGCFWAPETVLVDSNVLSTLDAPLRSAGLSEIVKIAITNDAELFAEVEAMGPDLVQNGFPTTLDDRRTRSDAIIGRAIELRLQELAPTCFERRSLQRLLDFGHSVSPAIEEASGYVVSHGEAVALDMALSAAMAVELGVATEATLVRILGVIGSLDLPLWSGHLNLELVSEAMGNSAAHRNGSLNMVVPAAPGDCVFIADPAEGIALAAPGLERLHAAVTALGPFTATPVPTG